MFLKNELLSKGILTCFIPDWSQKSLKSRIVLLDKLGLSKFASKVISYPRDCKATMFALLNLTWTDAIGEKSKAFILFLLPLE